jgi:hypothetical protein
MKREVIRNREEGRGQAHKGRMAELQQSKLAKKKTFGNFD